ncbi:hypothetical protein ACJIZ3_007244 [Penstemon smallii]|uniref:Uncharacterized protein n=1 Tax=Penstemon smallii TaxID=265156 RepID=A0ABD3SA22_9LAMI
MVITEFAIKLLRDIKSQSHFFFFISFSRATQLFIYGLRPGSLFHFPPSVTLQILALA